MRDSCTYPKNQTASALAVQGKFHWNLFISFRSS